ncbi:MAG: tRNA threonylcarbamoyladenosine dehydratase [Marinilabiliales bacterium]|nr:MAG: tRNA threonylcarbamoyladenosine dehydratase [Marinilabiliales bacterium]
MNKTNWQSRTELLIGSGNLQQFTNAHVLVVGLGGVGAYAAEMLCRAGIGKLTIVDGDNIHTTNRNRQLPALIDTEGKSKAYLLEERFKKINPEIDIKAINTFLKENAITELLQEPYSYIIDAIDTLSPKVFLIYKAIKNKQKIVSAMGAAGKLDPGLIEVCDISQSKNCKLARFVRKKLHRLDIYTGFDVVYSPEPVSGISHADEPSENKLTTLGTISYMPAIFGCYCASVVIRNLLKTEHENSLQK